VAISVAVVVFVGALAYILWQRRRSAGVNGSM
jgi:hypothetical protein